MTKPVYSHRRKVRSSKPGAVTTNVSGANNSIVDSKKIEYAEDPCHSNETPFCQMLSDFAHEIIPTNCLRDNDIKQGKDNHEVSSSSGLALLIREHLVSEMLQNVDSNARSISRRQNKQHSLTQCNYSSNDDKTGEAKAVLESKHNNNSKDRQVTNIPALLIPTSCSSESTTILDRFLEDQMSTLVYSRVSENKNLLRPFLESVLAQQEERSGIRYTLRTHLKKALPSTEYSCHVQFSEVNAAITAIACPDCRGAVRKVIKSEFCLEVLPPPDDSIIETYNDDNAFDYIAMEEGANTKKVDEEKLIFRLVNPRNSRYENGDLLLPSSGWHLRRACLSSNSADSTSSSWTVEDILAMIKHYVIRTGFHHDTLVGARKVSDETISSICGGVESRVSGIAKEFRDMAKELEIQVEKFVNQQGEDQRRVEAHPEIANIDMRSFPVMLDTDKLCCKVIERLLLIVVNVAFCVRRIVAKHCATMASRNKAVEACAWAIEPCKDLWKTFWFNVDSCCEHINIYEEQLFGIGDRLGNIPAKYLNSRSRAVYRTLVDAKIRIVHKMLSSIDRIMNHQSLVQGHDCENWSTTFMKHIFTVDSFSEVLTEGSESSKEIGSSKVDENTIDKKFHEMLKYVAVTWSRTIQDDNIRKLRETHTCETRQFIALVNELTCECTNVQPLKDNLDSLLGSIEPSTLADRRSCYGTSLAELSLDWMLSTTSESEIKDCTGLPISVRMPLKLRRAMVVGSNQLYVSTCDGKNGKLRTVGLLVGLFIKGWLLEKYKEWHARRAEEELLTTIAGELNDTPSHSTNLRSTTDTPKQNTITKKTKRKKKKKTDGDSVTANSDQDVNVMEVDYTVERLHSMPTNDNRNNSESNSYCIDSTDLHSPKESPVVDFDAVKGNTEQDPSRLQPCDVTPSIKVELSDPIISSESQKGDSNYSENSIYDHFSVQDVEAQVNVLVHTASGPQSAEKYLVERFSQLLANH